MANIYSMVDTWNDSGTTFNAIKMNVTDTASAADSLLMDLQVGGATKFSVDKAGIIRQPSLNIGSTIANFVLNTGEIWARATDNFSGNNGIRVLARGFKAQSNDYFGFAGATSLGTQPDVALYRDAAGTLAQRNGTNAQTFNLYNTYTDASNYERGFMKWNSNVLEIGTEAAGTGANRNIAFVTGISGTVSVGLNSNFSTPSTNPSTGNGAYIGHGMRRANVAVGLGFFFGESINNTTPGFDVRPVSGTMVANGILARFCETSDASTIGLQIKQGGFLQFGGITSSFPAIKRSTTSLQARLADDTDFTNIQGKLTTETAYTAGAPTATGYIVLYDSTGTAYKVPAEAL